MTTTASEVGDSWPRAASQSHHGHHHHHHEHHHDEHHEHDHEHDYAHDHHHYDDDHASHDDDADHHHHSHNAHRSDPGRASEEDIAEHFLGGLRTRDSAQRARELDRIVASILRWAAQATGAATPSSLIASSPSQTNLLLSGDSAGGNVFVVNPADGNLLLADSVTTSNATSPHDSTCASPDDSPSAGNSPPLTPRGSGSHKSGDFDASLSAHRHSSSSSSSSSSHHAHHSHDQHGRTHGLTGPERARRLLNIHLPSILRLTTECPFADVRDRFQRLLTSLRDKAISLPYRRYNAPSRFIPTPKLMPMNEEPGAEASYQVMVDSFLHDCRVSHFVRALSYHPTYLAAFLHTHHFILRGDGPLPAHWRNYIAIMAAARCGVKYVVSVQQSTFLVNGGDTTWLKGLEFAPVKLQNLDELNMLLAYQPWRVTAEHIRTLLRGQDSWSLAELVQAIVVLTHFHSVSAIAAGAGLTPEVDLEGGHLFATESERAELAEQLNSSQDAVGDATDSSWTAAMLQRLNAVAGEADVTEEENVKNFEKSETEFNTGHIHHAASASDINRFIRRPDFAHEDFDIKSREYSVFRYQDYSWEDHGFSLVDRFYESCAQLLDQQFSIAKTMTYATMGGQGGIDTQKLRYAVWYYITRVNGILHDDFNYGTVNELLEREVKLYIKRLACSPAEITQAEYVAASRGLLPSEKIHIAILATEANKQAGLMYALHAVMKYMA
ncbi:sestrin 1 [Capsaspora owczarzaki ATCC 30864]|uniref:Sestrin 1 n=1 Tax=Capsaspora owczarzaki (strain ATCC 30864) TaxID=595528 RepID=A0A0D2VRW9_CAPO3|nr:sestrin 1 [Capsaspora owczarzaki ATCC 30864]KJE93692.1 sestrin 1 [Capsaspora owczarzaki ATCC 30864]|eukprot:XP_004348274.1 sestrin 1 [Capsaspora owczarzaki ATCC 30864]